MGSIGLHLVPVNLTLTRNNSSIIQVMPNLSFTLNPNHMLSELIFILIPFSFLLFCFVFFCCQFPTHKWFVQRLQIKRKYFQGFFFFFSLYETFGNTSFKNQKHKHLPKRFPKPHDYLGLYENFFLNKWRCRLKKW